MSSSPAFHDRVQAAGALAVRLGKYAAAPDVIVLGLARGGVPIARRVADVLGAPFAVVVSRRIRVPGIEEVALGAIAEGSHRVIADDVAWYIGVPPRILEKLAARESAELERRTRMFRVGRPMPDLRGRTVILVDDGMATGATLRAAARAIRNHRPRRLIAAVPVASRSSVHDVRAEVDELVALLVPEQFQTVASSYEDYPPVSDEEVLTLLGHPTRVAIANGRSIASDVLRDVSERIASDSSGIEDGSRHGERTIEIPFAAGTVVADLGMPRHASSSTSPSGAAGVRGLAILAHGGGSSRNSYRNRYIAGRLRLGGYATLRVDLVTREERATDDAHGTQPFDIARLAAQLEHVCDWAVREGIAGAHRMSVIGASTGAAAAMTAAARWKGRITAVVARGGRVDLATDALAHVQSRVLLIAGADDRETVQRSREAIRILPGDARLVRIPGAGCAFDEPGALGAVAEHVVRWLDRPDARELRFPPRGTVLARPAATRANHAGRAELVVGLARQA